MNARVRSALALIAFALANCNLAPTSRHERIAVRVPTLQASLGQNRGLATTPLLAAPPDVAAPPSAARAEPCGSHSKLINAGSGASFPADDDRVTLEYTSFSRDGKLIDSSRLRGEPSEQTVRRLWPGLICVVERMLAGETRRVWVPAALAFTDEDANASATAPDVTIDLTLLRFERAPRRPPDLRSPPRSAERLARGVYFERLAKPTREPRPTLASRVALHHSGWTRDGVLFETSAFAKQAATYLVRDLPPGLKDCVLWLRSGEKGRFWIPESLARREQTRSALSGPLVYDVELVHVE